jgi:hypothetical protein
MQQHMLGFTSTTNRKNRKEFKYQIRIIINTDDDSPAVEQQLNKARKTWGRIGKIVRKKSNSNPKVLVTFYKGIVQRILLYGSESWAINKGIMSKLNIFHCRCAHFITGRHIKL